MSDYSILAIGIYLNLATITIASLARLGVFFVFLFYFRGTIVLMYFQAF